MNLQDLLGRSVKDLSDEELEAQISMLTRSKVQKPSPSGERNGKKKKEVKSNQDRQIDDFVKSIPKEKLAELLKKLTQ